MDKEASELGPRGFGGVAVSLARNPLSIIALFIVMVYSMASLVLVFSERLQSHEISPLVYFLVGFPVLVLASFVWLVAYHNDKLFAPFDFKDPGDFLKLKLAAAIPLALATAKSGEAVSSADLFRIAQDVLATQPSGATPAKGSRNRILWVDDHPDNNIYERQAFEALGLKINVAVSTDDALDRLANGQYAVIISDMGRPEGDRAGYDLLEKVRSKDKTTPFFIYAGADRPEFRQEAKRRGAQGSTNDPQELFNLVTRAVIGNHAD